MLISCPRCETTFSLPDEFFRPGRKARCSQCGNIFPMELPEAEAPAPDISEPLPSLEPESVHRKKRGRLYTPLLIVLVLLCVAGIGAGVWMVVSSLSGPSQPVEPPGAADADRAAEAAARVAHIDPVDVRQFIVKNDKLGDMVVIKGRAVNNFKEPKRFIVMEARLLSKNGTEIARQTRLCGADPFLTQLQVLSAGELEEALSNRMEILVNNSNVPPGRDTPFWFVFPPVQKPGAGEGEEGGEKKAEGEKEEPWKDFWEFEVHPVDAEDVPPSETAPAGNG